MLRLQAGLQIWGENGKLQIDTTKRLTKIIGVVDTNAKDGSIEVDELAQGRPWFAYARVGYLGPSYDPGQNGVLIWALPLVGFSDVGVKMETDEEKKEMRIKSIRMTWKYGTEVLIGVAGYRNMPVTIVYGVY